MNKIKYKPNSKCMSVVNFYTASVYAKAILMLENSQDEIKQSVSEIKTIASYDISKLTFSVFKKLPLSKITINFLQVLFSQNKQHLIKMVSEILQQKFLSQNNVNLVKISSAEPLSKETEEEIKNILQNCFKQEIILEQIINPKLIGGFTLLVNGYVADFSKLNQIVKIKSCIL